ncbi:hypothetical protein [Rufibacter roseus]|uniref:Chain length determinant protein n=1 Tax=Rufibacter roseus TaxID=1567108 RepID=A0ABW2DQJ1_9BACT|nr:hypothetical protein [Rufibacter roseus]
MNEFKSAKSSVGDEIDLKTVFDKIGAFFKSILNIIISAIKLTLRRWLFLVPFVLVGLGLGYLAYKVTKPYYKSSMVMMLSNIRNDFVKDHLHNLSELVSEENYEEIAKNLDFTVEEAKQIKEMSFANLDEEKIENDSVLTGSPFRIELKLYDNKLFSKMETALANYLENNPYFSRNKSIREQQVLSLLSKLKTEIASIDSIKTVVVNPKGPVNGFIYGEATDPTNLYKEGISLFERRTMLEAELKKLDNIQVVVGFTNRLKPASLSLKKYMFFGGVLTYLLGLSILFAMEQKKEISTAASRKYTAA